MMLNLFRRGINNRGSILVLAMWVMLLLSIFAVQVGMRIRQRATLLSRLESKSQLRHAAEAGIKKGISALKTDLQRNKFIYTPYGKFYRHNNPSLFSEIDLGDVTVSVNYNYYEGAPQFPVIRYGIIDEESKININFASRRILGRLIQRVITPVEDEAMKLTDSIIDWRSEGRSQLIGFYSDDYYMRLKHPYEPKDSWFETTEELYLLSGFNTEITERLKPFITVWGDGQVNINTASREVLVALGLTEEVADKVLLARRGQDGQDATTDDFIFQNVFDIAVNIQNYVKLEIDEIKQIDALIRENLIKTNSLVYMIHAVAKHKTKKHQLMVDCVLNIWENRIDYWREK